jgi:hypothetical protein
MPHTGRSKLTGDLGTSRPRILSVIPMHHPDRHRHRDERASEAILNPRSLAVTPTEDAVRGKPRGQHHLRDRQRHYRRRDHHRNIHGAIAGRPPLGNWRIVLNDTSGGFGVYDIDPGSGNYRTGPRFRSPAIDVTVLVASMGIARSLVKPPARAIDSRS